MRQQQERIERERLESQRREEELERQKQEALSGGLSRASESGAGSDEVDALRYSTVK